MKNIFFTTLSIGYNYTKDYGIPLIEQILEKTIHKIVIATDQDEIINNFFGVNDRIIINKIIRSEIVLRLPSMGPDYLTDPQKQDFNFNLKYKCFEPLLDIEDCYIFYTDCDNSMEWWDEDLIQTFFDETEKAGYGFLACRSDYKWGIYLSEYYNQENKNFGLFWHKILNYDLDSKINEEWWHAPLPAEHIFVLLGTSEKLKNFYNKFKWFHDYLINKGYSYGTWAEGFEIGVSSYLAGYKSYELGWGHPLLSKAIKYNGQKIGTGKPTHQTER